MGASHFQLGARSRESHLMLAVVTVIGGGVGVESVKDS